MKYDIRYTVFIKDPNFQFFLSKAQTIFDRLFVSLKLRKDKFPVLYFTTSDGEEEDSRRISDKIYRIDNHYSSRLTKIDIIENYSNKIYLSTGIVGILTRKYYFIKYKIEKVREEGEVYFTFSFKTCQEDAKCIYSVIESDMENMILDKVSSELRNYIDIKDVPKISTDW